MDPLSIGAGAAGFISLALDVTKDLVKYYRTWNTQDEHLQAVIQRLAGLEAALSLFEGPLSRLTLDQPDTKDAVEKLALQVESAVEKLKATVQRCKQHQPPTNFKEKVQLMAKRSIFPFRKQTIDGIEKVIDQLRANLSLANNALELHIAADSLKNDDKILQKFTDVETTVNSTQLTVQSLDSTTQATYSSVNNLDTAIQPIGLRTERMETSISDIARDASNMSSSIATMAQNSIPLIDAKLQVLALQSRDSARSIEAIASHVDDGFNRVNQQLADMQSSIIQTNGLTSNMTAINQGLAVQIMQKPSLQQSMCGQVSLATSNQNYQQSTSYAFSSQSFSQAWCSCVKQTRQQRQEYRFGLFTVYGEDKIISLHAKNCPYYITEKRSSTRGVRTTMLTSFLSKTVEMALMLPTGAGGNSIGLSLNLRTVVDERVAPAFLTLEDDRPFKTDTTGEYARSCLLKIGKLFRDGLASPYDIDSNGRNLLHILMRNFTYQNVLSFMFLVRGLVDAGVPINDLDSDRNSPLANCIERGTDIWKVRFGEDNEYLGLVRTFADLGAEERSLSRPRTVKSGIDATKNLRVFDTDIEAFRVGPLGSAILDRSESQLREVLSQYPIASNDEKFMFNQNLLHLACDWPEGLQILLSEGAGQQINQPDNQGALPIAYACVCSNVSSMQVLFNAKSCLYDINAKEEWLEAETLLAHALRYGSFASQSFVANAITERRILLYKLATANLQPQVLESLNVIKGRTLDVYARDVCDELIRHGVKVPDYLAIHHDRGTIYRVTAMSTGIADVFWQNGFLDILEKGIFEDTIYSLCRNARMEMVEWVFDKVADHLGLDSIGIKNTGMSSVGLAHMLAAAHSFSHHFLGGSILPKSLHVALACDDNDECYCPCSSNGCTPLTKILRGLEIKERDSFLRWATNNRKYIDQWSIPIIRFASFEVLGIRHTCCELTHDGMIYMDEEEVRELEEEDRRAIEQLELLMVEFEEQFENLHESLRAFFYGPWRVRMIGALEPEGDSQNKDDAQRLKNIGVKVNLDDYDEDEKTQALCRWEYGWCMVHESECKPAGRSAIALWTDYDDGNIEEVLD